MHECGNPNSERAWESDVGPRQSAGMNDSSATKLCRLLSMGSVTGLHPQRPRCFQLEIREVLVAVEM
jgi:hypothetical protein